MAKIVPEIYRDIKIVKTTVRVAAGKKMPQLVVRFQCEVRGQLLRANSWRALELQIDEQLDGSNVPQSAH
jgi:hypothetical protein